MTKFADYDEAMPCWVDVMVGTDEEHEALRAFLSALFDWTWQIGDPEMGSYALAITQDLPVLGLGIMEGARGTTTAYFSTSDIDDAVARATDAGATVVVAPMPVTELGSMALLVDPVGASFGVWQPGTFQGFGVMHEINAPGWFEHTSEDPERATEFYLKWSGHQLASAGEGMTVLTNGDAWYADLAKVDGASPRWTPIYVVDSLERARDVITRHGGAILVDEMPVPGSAICVFTEPVNGNTMTIMRGGEQPEA